MLDGEGLHDRTPAVIGQVDSLERLAAFREEEVAVADLAGGDHPFAQR
jgi:hypothetical protein